MDLLILIFSVLGNLALGSLVYFKNPRSSTNKLFVALTTAIVLMLVSNYFSVANKNPDEILIAIRFAMFFASVLSFFYLLFVITFPKQNIPLTKLKLFLLIISTLITMIVALSPYMFTSLQVSGSGVQPIPGPGIALFALTAVGSITFSIFTLFIKSRNRKGIERLQFNFILLGTATMFGLIILTIFIPVNLFNFSAFAPFLPVYTLAFVGSTAYAIVRHRLLDIRAVVARTVAFGSLASVLFIFYVAISILATTLLLKTIINLQQTIIFGVLTIVIGYTFQPLRKIFTNTTDKIFFKEDYDSNQLLSNLTKIMAETILIDDIAHKLLYEIIFQMRLSRGSFVLTDAGKVFVTESQGFKENPVYSEKDVFSLQALDKNLIFEDLEESPIKELMRKLDVTIVIPLKTQVDHVGLLLLGEKAS